MKVDSSASYSLRQLAAAALAASVLGGCSATGEATGDRTFSDRDVPFTFRLPAEFTKAKVDSLNSRGLVVAGAGVDKLDVVAVRRLAAPPRIPLRAERHSGIVMRTATVPHSVRGHAVVSRVYVFGFAGGTWAIECQWLGDRRGKVLRACRRAIETIARR